MADIDKTASNNLLFKPIIGTTLAVCAGLSFFFLCMILPLVGPAGSKVEHAAKNKEAFSSVLLVTFALAATATWSKLGRRKSDGAPLPIFSLGLCVVCILSFIVLMMGGFAI